MRSDLLCESDEVAPPGATSTVTRPGGAVNTIVPKRRGSFSDLRERDLSRRASPPPQLAAQEAVERQQPLAVPGALDARLQLAVGRLQLPPARLVGVVGLELDGVVGIDAEDQRAVVGGDDLEFQVRVVRAT